MNAVIKLKNVSPEMHHRIYKEIINEGMKERLLIYLEFILKKRYLYYIIYFIKRKDFCFYLQRFHTNSIGPISKDLSPLEIFFPFGGRWQIR